jgi:hypothetical protein
MVRAIENRLLGEALVLTWAPECPDGGADFQVAMPRSVERRASDCLPWV